MVCDGLQWSAMVCDASGSSKLQENGPFHRNVWPGLSNKATEILNSAFYDCTLDLEI